MNAIANFESARPNPNHFEVKDIEPQELWKRRDEVLIVDVRRPDEYTGELGHIPGSKLIVMDTLPEHIDEIPRDKTVVFVCRSGTRSGHAASWAISEGIENVYNLRGGMLLWQKLNMETVK